jgi:putative solute:sodium symporter small subunit
MSARVTTLADIKSQSFYIDGAESMPELSKNKNQGQQYWAANRRLLLILLSLWAIFALGAPVVFVDWLDQFSIGGFALGFWFNQQGSILIFVAIIFIYHFLMLRIERRYDFDVVDKGQSNDEQNNSSEKSQ